MFTPKMESLLKPTVWLDAATQVDNYAKKTYENSWNHQKFSKLTIFLYAWNIK